MPRTKGAPKTGGRRRGTPNRTTKTVKDALTACYVDLGGGTALKAWAQGNPTDFYKLWAKLLPQDVTITPDSLLRVVFSHE